MLLLEINTYFSDLPFMKSISLISPDKNAKLNRAELLILLKGAGQELELQNTILNMNKTLSLLQSKLNIKIDYLILIKEGFQNLLRSDEINPLKEVLSDQITFLSPQAFWNEIKTVFENGMQIRFSEKETNPAKISEIDLVCNLARFGYKEMGSELREGEKICIEYIVASILMEGTVRRLDAIPVILAKNNVDYSLLVFLAQKYSLLNKLSGILEAMYKIKPLPEVFQALKTLEAMDVKGIKTDEKRIEREMRAYDAIK